MSHKVWIAIPSLALLALGVVATLSFADDAIGGERNIQTVADVIRVAEQDGAQDRVVAMVDGQPILQADITGTVAFSSLSGVESHNGVQSGTMTEDEAFQYVLEGRVLAAAGVRQGISADPEHVTAIIQLGQIQPLESDDTPIENKNMLQAYFALYNVDPKDAVTDEGWRKGVADGIIAAKYVESTGLSRKEALERARAIVQVEDLR